MYYNFDIQNIIDGVYEIYLDDNTIDVNYELKLIIYNVVFYNDNENNLEIINSFGGLYKYNEIYENNLKNNNINNYSLNYYQNLAFIALYENSVIELNKKINIENDIDFITKNFMTT